MDLPSMREGVDAPVFLPDAAGRTRALRVEILELVALASFRREARSVRGMTERTAWAVKVYGAPAPKGSLKCVGRGGRHQLVEDSDRTKPWRELIAQAGRALKVDPPLAEPVGVSITFTLELPKSVNPELRVWPYMRSSRGIGGDIDKLARTVLDGLQDAHVFIDDSQVCELMTTKVYPHTDAADVLDQPGAVIRIYLL